MWKRVGSILRFCLDEDGTMCLDSTCFATGAHPEFLCCLLNSKMGHYLLKDSPTTGTGDLLVSVQAVEPIRVPTIDDEQNGKFKRLMENRQEQDIEDAIFDLYGLDEEERAAVGFVEIR